MKKIEVIFSEERIDILKNYADQRNLTVCLSEVMLYEPGRMHIKKYRGAEYRVEQVRKIKAEIFANDEIISEAQQFFQQSLMEKDKGDRYVIYEIEAFE